MTDLQLVETPPLAEVPKTRAQKTRENREKFLEALTDTGGSVAAACRAVNITRTTAYRWRKNKTFAKKWNEAIEAALDNLEEIAYQIALNGQDPNMIRWMLSRRRSDKWGEKQVFDHRGAVKIEFPAPIVIRSANDNPDLWKEEDSAPDEAAAHES